MAIPSVPQPNLLQTAAITAMVKNTAPPTGAIRTVAVVNTTVLNVATVLHDAIAENAAQSGSGRPRSVVNTETAEIADQQALLAATGKQMATLPSLDDPTARPALTIEIQSPAAIDRTGLTHLGLMHLQDALMHRWRAAVTVVLMGAMKAVERAVEKGAEKAVETATVDAETDRLVEEEMSTAAAAGTDYRAEAEALTEIRDSGVTNAVTGEETIEDESGGAREIPMVIGWTTSDPVARIHFQGAATPATHCDIALSEIARTRKSRGYQRGERMRSTQPHGQEVSGERNNSTCHNYIHTLQPSRGTKAPAGETRRQRPRLHRSI